MSFKSQFEALLAAGGFLPVFGILILIWICSLEFDTLIFKILALYLDFEGAKNIHVLSVLFMDFDGGWRYLTEVWHLDLDMVISLYYTHIPNYDQDAKPQSVTSSILQSPK